jgi:transcriptional regulator with XRE-family HTH domain
LTAERLWELRKDRSLSFKKLSQEIEEKTGVYISATQLQKYEDTDRTDVMNVRNLVAIADFYGVSYDYLLGYSEAKERDYHSAVEQTGLSEKAVKILKTWVEGVNETDANGVQFTRNVNTKAPKELSTIIESKEFRRLMGYIRALKYVSGEDDGTVKNFFLGPAKVAVLKAELGSRSVRDYIIFLALNTFRDILNEIIPHVPSVDRGWRKATQADIDDIF